MRHKSPSQRDDEEQKAANRVLKVTFEDRVDALFAVIDAAEHIWRSIKKFNGDPTINHPHPINCPCGDCS